MFGVSREIFNLFNDLTLGYQTSDSASSSNFQHLPLLALLVALVLSSDVGTSCGEADWEI